MKKLLVALLLCPAATIASPFIVTDPVDSRTTHCGVFVDAFPKQTIAVTLEGVNKTCKHDLAGITDGVHTVRITAIVANDPIWGSQESPQSAPLQFVKPATPPAPSGARLSP